MIPWLSLGAGLGAGLWALTVWASPPRLDLPTLLRRLDPRPPTAAGRPVVLPGSMRGLLPLATMLSTCGLPRAPLVADLAVLQRPVMVHLAAQAGSAIAGAIAPVLCIALLLGVGVDVDRQLPVWAGLVGMTIGLLVPDHAVRAAARRRRQELRQVLAAYLDLVVVALAGGAGIEGAMTDAAAAGRGWAFDRLRHALTAARLTNTTSWSALGRLGAELSVPELVEFAAATSLAGSEGAKVRASLAAYAATWRVHQLTEAEADANAATERMSLPVVLLFAGFLLFVGYPAVAAALGGF